MKIRSLKGLKMPFQATLLTEFNMELESYGMGLRSGRGHLNKAINLALQHLIEDLRTGRVEVPEWAATAPVTRRTGKKRAARS